MMKDRVEARLAALNINSFQAARRAGRNQHFIHDFLLGKKKSIKGMGLEQVANALECSVDYLMGTSDAVGKPPNPGSVAPIEDFSTRKPTPPTGAARRPHAPHGALLQRELEGSDIGHVDAAQPRRGMRLGGTIEADVFRRPSAFPKSEKVIPILPDPRFPRESQTIHVLRGQSLSAIGIYDGMILTVVPVEEYEAAGEEVSSGTIMALRFTRHSPVEEIELSARELRNYPDRVEYIGCDTQGVVDTITVSKEGILRAGVDYGSSASVEALGVVVNGIRIM